MPEPTDFIAAVQTRQATCGNHAGWASLAAERAIGLGRFAEALRVVESVASATDATLAVREQHGVLLHWTGQHARAESVLRTVVAESPGSARAADALIDVLRLTGRADAAWEIAAVEWRPADVALDRQLALAELALETGRVIEAGALARALLDRASGDAVVSHRAYAIAATTLVALGRASEAKDLLHDRAPLESPSTALPWLDAVASTEGVSAALRSADGISAATTAEWADVSARRAVWLAQMGRHRDAERVVTSLEATNATAARLARADVALATGRTADAESLLRPLIESRSQVVRARDGLSTALAEQGRWDEAFVELDELRRARPHEARWAIRSAEWRHRQSPSARTLGALEVVVAGAAGSPDATLALARAYFRAGRYARVESILSGAAFAASEQALGLRARSLRAAGAPDRALSLLEARTALPVDLLLLKAQLVATLSGLPAADDEFTRLTALAEADPMWYLAWADLHTDGPGQRRVLDLATARFPDAPLLLERLGVVAWAERDDRVAAQAADAALARDRSRQGAWFVKIAAAGAHGSSGAVTRLMNEYATAFAGSPSALLDMGDMLAALARSPGDPAAVAALAWTDAILAAQPNHGGALVTRARLLASLGRLAEAMAILADLTATRPEMPLAHKVQAELFVVHGRFAEAAAAYDRYFALNPGDLAARRLQARIDGWRGATASSLARYSRLRADAPGVPAIEAEAAAKRAYYRGDWRDAIAHYDAWLALEPDDVEARLERAQAYDHQGDTVVARQAYDALASRVPAHRVAVEAASRLERRRAPSVDFFTHGTSADGPSRRQELEIVDAGVGVSDGLGSGYGTRARVFGGPSFAATGDRDWSGRHVGAELVTTPRRTLELSAATTYRDWSGADAQWSAESRARVKATQAVAVSAAFGRTLLLENASTLETGLAGVGPSGEISWTPHVDFALDLSAGRLALNDDNTRDTVRAAVSQRVWRRANEVRLVAASEFLSYAEGRATYFTPSNFWRHDVGAEWRGWLDTPQFFGDKERWVSAAYLFGVDNRHEQYHTARVGAAYEFANGVGAVADALIVRSRVYDGARRHAWTPPQTRTASRPMTPQGARRHCRRRARRRWWDACRSADTALLEGSWRAYRNRFVTADGRVVRPESGNDTVSEGQAYAMLRAVWMDDRRRLRPRVAVDARPSWAHGPRRLVVDGVALESRQWRPRRRLERRHRRRCRSRAGARHGGGPVVRIKRAETCLRIRDAARQVLAELIAHATTTDRDGTRLLLPGVWADQRAEGRGIVLNPSYFAPASYRVFAQLTGDPRWLELAAGSYQVLDAVCATGARPTPIPDWVRWDSREAWTADGGASGAKSSWDAVRIPWRVATDAMWFGAPEAKRVLADCLVPFMRAELTRGHGMAMEHALDGTVLAFDNHPLSNAMYAFAFAGAADRDRLLARIHPQAVQSGRGFVFGEPDRYYVEQPRVLALPRARGPLPRPCGAMTRACAKRA